MKIPSLAIAALLLSIWSASSAAPGLSPAEARFLTAYEKIQTALAADDLPSAKKAARDLGPDDAALGKSNSLEAARASFATLSLTAEKLAAGRPGYHIFHCGMADQDWVQTTPQANNPYTGKTMSTCGEMKQ